MDEKKNVLVGTRDVKQLTFSPLVIHIYCVLFAMGLN